MFSRPVMTDSSWPHGLQHTSLPHPSQSPGDCPSSCPLHPWYHPTISTSIIPFSFWLQSFPASLSFSVCQLFTIGSQSTGDSASSSVLLTNIQGWFPLRLTGLISVVSKGISRVFSSTTIGKHQFFSALPSLWSISHNRAWLLKRPGPWLYRPLSAKWCLCFLTHCLGLFQFSCQEAFVF